MAGYLAPSPRAGILSRVFLGQLIAVWLLVSPAMGLVHGVFQGGDSPWRAWIFAGAVLTALVALPASAVAAVLLLLDRRAGGPRWGWLQVLLILLLTPLLVVAVHGDFRVSGATDLAGFLRFEYPIWMAEVLPGLLIAQASVHLPAAARRQEGRMPGRALSRLRFGLLSRVAVAHLALNLLVVSPYLAWTFYDDEVSRDRLYAMNALSILRWVTLPALVAVVLILAASRGRAEHDTRGFAELSVGLLGAGLSALVLWTSGLLSDGDGGFVLRATVVFHMVAVLLARASRWLRGFRGRHSAGAQDDA